MIVPYWVSSDVLRGLGTAPAARQSAMAAQSIVARRPRGLQGRRGSAPPAHIFLARQTIIARESKY